MPIPKPKPGETQNDWVSRCMSNDTMKEEFQDQDQRVAVCYQIWRDSKKSPTGDDWDSLAKDIKEKVGSMKDQIDGAGRST